MNRSLADQRGLSMVELMVSVAISVAVLSALSYVYVGSRTAYRTNEALARVQETGRFALEMIGRDLRSAGYAGCLSRAAAPTIYTKSCAGPVLFDKAVFGYENGTGFVGGATADNCRPNPTTISYRAGSGDVIVVSRLFDTLQDPVAPIKEASPGDANLKVDVKGAVFEGGEDLVVGDCERAAIFNATAVAGATCAGPSGQFACISIAHDGPGNDPAVIHAFGTDGGSFVGRYGRIGYFVGTNSRSGRPALYRFQVNGSRRTTEEIVENVEDVDVLYGVDTGSDGSVDQYLTAAQVAGPPDRWAEVVSVRISLKVVACPDRWTLAGKVSNDCLASTGGGQVVYMRDTKGDDTVVDPEDPAADRLLRQVFTTTIALRNRLP